MTVWAISDGKAVIAKVQDFIEAGPDTYGVIILKNRSGNRCVIALNCVGLDEDLLREAAALNGIT